MIVCDSTCQPPCSYGCALRQKGVQVAPSATPNRHNRRAGRAHQAPWEQGTISETRCDGSKMPLLEPGTRHPLHVKQYGENRRAIDEQVQRLKTSTTPLREPVGSP